MEFWTLKEAFSNFSSSTLMEIWTLSSHGERALPPPPPTAPPSAARVRAGGGWIIKALVYQHRLAGL